MCALLIVLIHNFYCTCSRLLGRLIANGVLPVVLCLLPLHVLYVHRMSTVPVHTAVALPLPVLDMPFVVLVGRGPSLLTGLLARALPARRASGLACPRASPVGWTVCGTMSP